MGESVLHDILQVSRVNNEQLGVTGMLLYQNGSFFQVLEGEKKTVETLYEKIVLDSRHERSIKIIFEPIQERSFSHWTMGYASLSNEDLQTIEGLNDFFTEGRSLIELCETRAKILLSAFKEGRWRGSLKPSLIQRKS